MKWAFCRILYVNSFSPNNNTMLNISEIIQTVRQLIDVRIQMIKEEINQQLATVLARVFLLFFIGLVILLIMIFASFTLAYLISEWARTPYMGFLVVSLLYVLLLIGLYMMRNSKKLIGAFHFILNQFLFGGKND
jgi:general stress protein CsbA